MIRINFIEKEAAERRRRRARRNGILSYTGIWLVSMLFLWISYTGHRARIDTIQREFAKVEEHLSKSKPQLLAAIRLYKQREMLEKNLSRVLNQTFDLNFIIENLQGVTRALPDNLWLNELVINRGKHSGKEKESFGIYANIKANIMLNPAEDESSQLHDFQVNLRQQAPFTKAESKLVLDNIQLYHDSTAYFHDFELALRWQQDGRH